MSTCAVCGEPMPPGEEMFKFHGYSGDCPKPPLPKPESAGAGEMEALRDDDDDIAWGMISILHENVPMADRPMGWCDFSDAQTRRIKRALAYVKDALSAPAPGVREAMEQALIYIEADEHSHGRKFGAGNALRNAIASLPPSDKTSGDGQ